MKGRLIASFTLLAVALASLSLPAAPDANAVNNTAPYESRYQAIAEQVDVDALATRLANLETYVDGQTNRINELTARVYELELLAYLTPTPAPATVTPLPPTATNTPTPTATPHVHPTQPAGAVGKCGEPMNVWHGNKWATCFTGHEHGDAPPQWVTAWATANNKPLPFSQTRESHTGYKGVFVRHASGAESYFIGHILSNAMARSHGDHDYQLWLKTTDGKTFYWDGLLCFAGPCAAQPPLRTSDTGERPIILAQNDGACETWYGGAEGGVVDVEWVICGRISHFDTSKTSGVGTHRTIGWIFYPDRFPANVQASMLRDCRVEFGFCRLQFLVSGKEYPNQGVVIPN
jgi:hypothetical protein